MSSSLLEFYLWECFKVWIFLPEKNCTCLGLETLLNWDHLIFFFFLASKSVRAWKSLGDSPSPGPEPRPIWVSILTSLLLTEGVAFWGFQLYDRVSDATSHFVWAPGFVWCPWIWPVKTLALGARNLQLLPTQRGLSAGLPFLVLCFLISSHISFP